MSAFSDTCYHGGYIYYLGVTTEPSGLRPIYRVPYLDPMATPEMVDTNALALTLWSAKNREGVDTLYCLGTGPFGGPVVWKNSDKGWLNDYDSRDQQISLPVQILCSYLC